MIDLKIGPTIEAINTSEIELMMIMHQQSILDLKMDLDFIMVRAAIKVMIIIIKTTTYDSPARKITSKL